MNDEAKLVLLGTWMALFVVFAGRKFTQPIKVPLLFTTNSNMEASKRVLANLLQVSECFITNHMWSGLLVVEG